MRNLQYIKKEARDQINDVLNSDGVHFFCKDVIKRGLNMDCVDVVYDLELAVKMLRLVMNDSLSE